MKLVTNFEELGPDNDIQVIAWPRPAEKPLVLSHTFSMTPIKRPVYCRECKALMWNLRKSCYRCSDCRASIHEKCIEKFTSGCSSRFCSAKLSMIQTDASLLQSSPVAENSADSSDTSKSNRINIDPPVVKSKAMNKYDGRYSHKDMVWLERGLKNIKVNGNEYSGVYLYVDGVVSKRVEFTVCSMTDRLKLKFENDQRVYVTGPGVGAENEKWRSVGIPGIASPVDIENICEQVRIGLKNIKFQKGIKSSFRLTLKKDKNCDFDDIFEIDTENILGAGRFGKVYCGNYKETKVEVAIKKVPIRNDSSNVTSTYEEAMLLFELNYPGILKCEGIFQRPDSVILVTEKLDIDMLDYILKSQFPAGRLTEAETKYLCFQLSTAIRYLHAKDIAHCDLKPENVLLKFHPDGNVQTKIADFGYARIIKDGAVRHTLVGTLAYLPPEVFNSDLRRHQGYNRSLDIWSFGVIAYVSLCGYFPYRDDKDLVEQIIMSSIFAGSVWNEISSAAKGYISEKLLVPDAGRRLNSTSLIYHEWFTKDILLLESLRKLEARVGIQWLTDEFQESPPESGESDCEG